MSYRGFKRLLGETSLERKCRFLFGAATLLLITGSFWWYAWNTEDVAYEQARFMGKILVMRALQESYLEGELTEAQRTALDNLTRELMPSELQFATEIIPARSTDAEQQKVLRKFDGTGLNEDQSFPQAGSEFNLLYEVPVRATGEPERVRVGEQLARLRWPGAGAAAPDELLGVVSIRMSTKAIQNRMSINRAMLIVTALVIAILLMGGSWLIVRYVIVKPVNHLKNVSDAITAGELNIRSEIQTGDEFEDLSHAFNRMLRTLVSMQDQLRRVNGDLDRKVDELAQANMALFQSNQHKSDFLATMSHELRTPLNSILGFSSLLLTSDQLSEKQRKWVDNIQSSGTRLLSLINDVLDLAKMEAGKMQVRVEEFSMHDTCEGLLNMFRPLADKKKLALTAHVDPGLPVLKQDASKIQQILWNLLSNAVKFTPEGGRVDLRAESDGVHLILSVADTGVGIAEEDQGVIFEKFRQAGSALTREQGGTGLGLSIVRELAKLLEGEVALHSELGRGSTFTVTLPLRIQPGSRFDFDLVHDEPMRAAIDGTGYTGLAAPRVAASE